MRKNDISTVIILIERVQSHVHKLTNTDDMDDTLRNIASDLYNVCDGTVTYIRISTIGIFANNESNIDAVVSTVTAVSDHIHRLSGKLYISARIIDVDVSNYLNAVVDLYRDLDIIKRIIQKR